MLMAQRLYENPCMLSYNLIFLIKIRLWNGLLIDLDAWSISVYSMIFRHSDQISTRTIICGRHHEKLKSPQSTEVEITQKWPVVTGLFTKKDAHNRGNTIIKIIIRCIFYPIWNISSKPSSLPNVPLTSDTWDIAPLYGSGKP